MTELNVAYNYNEFNEGPQYSPQIDQGGQGQMQTQISQLSNNNQGGPKYAPPPPSPQPQVQQQVQQPQVQQQVHVKEQFNDYAPAYPPIQNKRVYVDNGPTYWDRLIAKRVDIVKLFVLSLMIVLGLSLNTVASHYLEKYIDKSFMTASTELMLRLSYPMFILIIIWLLKAL